MKNSRVYFFLVLLSGLGACHKKGDVTNAPVVAPFVAHIDTFFGTVYESDTCALVTVNDSTGNSYVYVAYPSPDSIVFSSSHNSSSESRYTGEFAGSFKTSPSNSYVVYDSYSFTVSGDSLFYRGHQYHCPCDYTIYFCGRLIHSLESLNGH
jgi:hypothetical protein